MAFELSFAGIPLNIPNPTMDEWLENHLPIDDMRLLLPPRNWPGPGLLSVTYPYVQTPRPRFRLNQFFYPPQASRWSEYHGVISQRVYDLLVATVFKASPLTSQFQSFPFIMNQNGVGIQTPLYALPPRPLAKFNNYAGYYLLTLVDERYFWQYQHCGNLIGNQTWGSLIDAIASRLSIGAMGVNPSAVYGTPNLNSDLIAQYENAAILMDSCLANVGRVFVRSLDQSYHAYTTPDSAAINNSQLSWLAGGDSSDDTLTNGLNLTPGTILPQSVLITFPYFNCATGEAINAQYEHIPYSKNLGDLYQIEIGIGTAGYGQYPTFPFTETIHTQGQAWVINPGDTPLNLTDLTNLATQLATDFYASKLGGLDIVYPKIAPIIPTGLQEITWRWDYDHCSTRVQRLPYNYFICKEFNHGLAYPSSNCPSSSSPFSVTLLSDFYCDPLDNTFKGKYVCLKVPGGSVVSGMCS